MHLDQFIDPAWFDGGELFSSLDRKTPYSCTNRSSLDLGRAMATIACLSSSIDPDGQVFTSGELLRRDKHCSISGEVRLAGLINGLLFECGVTNDVGYNRRGFFQVERPERHKVVSEGEGHDVEVVFQRR